MKRTLLYIVPAIAVMLGISSCSTDNDIATAAGNTTTDNAVIIRASVGSNSIFTRTNPAGTDAEQQAKFNAGDQINVSNGSGSVNYTLGSDGSTWSATTSREFLKWSSEAVNFQAYYPVATGNTFASGTLPTDQSTVENIAKADYMTADTTVSKEPTDHTLNLTFKRKAARVIVKIAGYKNQYDATTTKVIGVKVYSQTAIPASGDYSAITTYNNGTDFIALVAPASANSTQQFLEITVEDINGVKEETVTGIPAMEAGKSYTYSITVGKDKATIENVTVTDWTTGNVIPGGKALINLSKDMTGVSVDDFKSYLESNIGTQTGVTLKLTGSFSGSAKDYYQEIAKYVTEHANADLTLDLSGMEITEIPDRAFYYRNGNELPQGLTHVILPSSVTKIGATAFFLTGFNGKGLESINLGNVTDIGEDAFTFTNFKNVDLTSATNIGTYAFGQCDSLTSFTAPTSMCNVGESAFSVSNLGADSDGKFTLPTTFKLTGRGPFYRVDKIKELTVPAAFMNDGNGCVIPSEVFVEMKGLTTVIFEAEKVASIGKECFDGCDALTTIDLSNLTTANDLPTINANGQTFSGITAGNVTVLVKDADMKAKFENDANWGAVGFKEFKVK